MDHPAYTHAEAEQVCVDNLGKLAFFKNEAEYNEYLKEPITEKEWLGVTRKDNGWQSADGSAPFLKWNIGEPNNENGENCVEIYTSGTDSSSQLMNDKSCGATNKFRCRIETYLDNDEKLRMCLNNPSADQCKASEIGKSCINAANEFKVSLEVRCNGVDNEHRGVAALSRESNDYYFGVGSVKGWPQDLFFWMENPNGLDAVGAEIITNEGSQWWQNSRNPTYVFPCTPGKWNTVQLTQFRHSESNKWIKTLMINGEYRYRITSDEPNVGALTAFDNIPGRQFSINQLRNFKIESFKPQDLTWEISDNSMSYDQARAYCVSRGKRLADPDNYHELETGVKYSLTPGKLVWFDSYHKNGCYTYEIFVSGSRTVNHGNCAANYHAFCYSGNVKKKSCSDGSTKWNWLNC